MGSTSSARIGSVPVVSVSNAKPCSVERVFTISFSRPRTNTPLQALVLMNDPQFMEAARNLAQVILNDRCEDKYAAILERALGHAPEASVTDILKQTYQRVRPIYQKDVQAAETLIHIGESPVDETLDPVELATWTIIANQVMNLDAFVTKS